MKDISSIDMILSNLIHDKFYFMNVIPFLEESFMDDGGSRLYIYKKIKENYEKLRSPLSIDAIKVILSKDFSVIENGDNFYKEILETLDIISEHICSEESLEFRLDQTKDHCQKIASEDAMEICSEMKEDINNGGIKYNYKDILNKFKEVTEIDFSPDQASGIDDDIDEFYEDIHNKDTFISTGISQIDKWFGGGVVRGECTMIAGPQNAGKTHLSISILCEFIRNSKNGLYISRENNKIRIKQRAYCNLLGISREEMLEIKNKDKLFDMISEVCKDTGRFDVIYDSTDNFTTEDIERIIKVNEYKYNIKYDIVVIDNLYNVESRDSNINKKPSSELYTHVTNEIRNIGSPRRCNTHMLLTHQLDLSEKDRLHPTEHDLARCKGVSWVLDALLTLGENKLYRDKGWVMVNNVKERITGTRGESFLLGLDKDHQKTYTVNTEDLKPTKADVKVDGQNQRKASLGRSGRRKFGEVSREDSIDERIQGI